MKSVCKSWNYNNSGGGHHGLPQCHSIVCTVKEFLGLRNLITTKPYGCNSYYKVITYCTLNYLITTQQGKDAGLS